VRLLASGVISVFLALSSLQALRGQDPPAAQPPPSQYFAGIVTTLSDTSLTITRMELGKSTVRSFAITKETVIKGGKPRLKAKVTVEWVSGETGDRALKIILRTTAPPPKKQ
jgi:hypothetical protein